MGRENGHSSTCSVEVQNDWSHTYTHPHASVVCIEIALSFRALDLCDKQSFTQSCRYFLCSSTACEVHTGTWKRMYGMYL